MKLAAVALVLALLSQDKVTFKHQPAKGDRLAQAEKMTMKIDATVKAGDQTIKITMEQKTSKKKNLEILEVEGGKVTKARFEVEEDVEEQKQPGAEEFTRTQKPMHGRKITVTSKDGALSYEGADGIDDKERKSLDLEDDFAKVFPKNAVAIGDSWDVSPEALKDMFEDEKLDGKMKLKLAEVKEHEGKRCAFLDAKLELKGKLDEGIDLFADLKGVVIVWIDKGYPLKAKLEGKVTMKGNAGGAEMTGEGPMVAEMTSTVK